MNKTALILSVVALMISTLLLINNFSGKKPVSTHTKSEVSKINSKAGDIAYVNIDSLIDSYDYYNVLKTALIAKQETEGAKIETRMRTLQRKAMELQKQVESKMMTPTTAQKKQQNLMIVQQQLMDDKQNIEMQLAEENQSLSIEVLDSVKVYLAELNKELNFKMILSSTTVGGTVLLAADGLDITAQAIIDLNKRYKATKTNTKKEEISK